MAKPITYVCSLCRSSKVLMDAWAQWDVRSQDWVLSDTLTQAYCQECDGETGLIEVESAALLAPA